VERMTKLTRKDADCLMQLLARLKQATLEKSA
jgi:hypothetical protein